MTPRKTRVLVLASTYPRWQGDTDPGFVHELCRRLVNHDLEVDVLAPRAPSTLEHERLDGVQIYRYPYFIRRYETLAYGGGILPKLKARPWLRALVPCLMLGLTVASWRALRRAQYDCIHAHWIVPQALCAGLAGGGRKVPMLITSHGGDLFGLRSRLARTLTGWTLRRGQRIAVVSNYMKTVVSEEFGIATDTIAVLPMGVDLTATFSAAKTERTPANIVFVGRLVEKKGLRYLLEALKIVRQSLPTATLDVVGDGPLREKLEQRVQDLHLETAVSFHGAVEQNQIPRYLCRASVAAIPSIVDASGDQEGLGLVTIEAMGCGCPVVASDLPAIRDVVEHEVTGLLATPADADQLAAKLVQLLSQPELSTELAENARKFALAHFNWDTVASAYASEIARTAEPPREQ